MCGIFGSTDVGKNCSELLEALNYIQHRGQDSAGVAWEDGCIKMFKQTGPASDLVKCGLISAKGGSGGIGHVRYATQGGCDKLNSQPFSVLSPFSIAIVHNGNIINAEGVRGLLKRSDKNILFETGNDAEVILRLFAEFYGRGGGIENGPAAAFNAALESQRILRGAYSVIALLGDGSLLGFKDPYGIRPLLLGKKRSGSDIIFAMASESGCLEKMGYEVVYNAGPGDIIYTGKKTAGEFNIYKGVIRKKALCSFEYVYFSKGDAVLNGLPVRDVRLKFGSLLANKIKQLQVEPDVVVPVPDSGIIAAEGVAGAGGWKLVHALVKKKGARRSFIMPEDRDRMMVINGKFNIDVDAVKGKVVAVVDDSIVRGLTSKYIVNLLKESGAAMVYYCSASPRVYFPCRYGIDTISGELAAMNFCRGDFCEYIGADELIYADQIDFKRIIGEKDCCFACFDGEYPVCEDLLCESDCILSYDFLKAA